MFLAQIDELANKIPDKDSPIWLYIGIGVGVLVALIILRKILKGKRRQPDNQKAMRENLDKYPTAPGKPGLRRLTVLGMPVRLRLVVVVPVGKEKMKIAPDDVPELLDDVLQGLGDFVNKDKPRIRVWAPQLSSTGFAPTFHRLIDAPDSGNQKKRWLKMAGQARSGGQPFLLGLAVYADTPIRFEDKHVSGNDWQSLLNIQTLNEE